MTAETLFFFNEHPDSLPAYAELERLILEQIPDVRIQVAKTQIGFFNKYGFARVSFLGVRRVRDRPKGWITVSFGLSYRKDSPRVDAATEPYPNRWTHHVMVGLDGIDEELMSWIREAAAFSASKR